MQMAPEARYVKLISVLHAQGTHLRYMHSHRHVITHHVELCLFCTNVPFSRIYTYTSYIYIYMYINIYMYVVERERKAGSQREKEITECG